MNGFLVITVQYLLDILIALHYDQRRHYDNLVSDNKFLYNTNALNDRHL